MHTHSSMNGEKVDNSHHYCQRGGSGDVLGYLQFSYLLSVMCTFLVRSISSPSLLFRKNKKDTRKMGGEQGPDNAVLPLAPPLFYREGVYKACLLQSSLFWLCLQYLS